MNATNDYNQANAFEDTQQPAQPQPAQQPEAPAITIIMPQPEAPITPASAAIVLTPHQVTMLAAMPVGQENAKLVCDIRAGFTIKYGRKLIAFLHTHGIINWVPKGSTARYKKWFRPQTAQIKS